MSTLDRKKLRRLIIKEIQKMKEDSLRPMHDDPGRQNYVASKGHHCYECGYGMKEGDSVCEQCGSMYEAELNEGDCGTCGTCDSCMTIDSDLDDDFIPDHMEDLNYIHPTHGKRKVSDITILDPDSAFGVGFEAGTSGVFDEDGDVKIGNHKHYKGSYMAKSHLYKVNKYAEKLYHMIPDGHNLEDWMRTKLAQIADDIGEVYHALDHDIYEGDI